MTLAFRGGVAIVAAMISPLTDGLLKGKLLGEVLGWCITTASPPPFDLRPRYGALAHSVSTGRIGMAFGWLDPQSAERGALQHCATPDAGILGWGWDCILVLARGPAGAVACGASPHVTLAREGALEQCRACYDVEDRDRQRVQVTLALDTRDGILYQAWNS
jgi:Domain of unknown function (DUF4189)